MEQIVLQPKRAGNILDLLFTNNMEIVHDVNLTPTLVSDHKIIELYMYGLKFARDKQPNGSIQNLSSLNLHNADWKSILKEILKQD